MLTEIVELSFSGIIGAFSAYLFNLFHWKKVETIRLKEAKVNSIISALEQTRILSVKYWSCSYESDFPSKVQDESLIKSLLLSQSKLLSSFSSKYTSSLTASEVYAINSFSSDIFDLVTGGDFEGHRKNIETKKCQTIASKYSKIEVIFRLL